MKKLYYLFAFTVALALASGTSLAQTIYNQATFGNFANGTNLVEKSAAAPPNDNVTFSNLVKAAFTTNSGGVFDFPSAITAGTTIFRGTYAGGTKRMQISSSITMQNSTAGGNTIYPVSNPNVATSSADNSDYTLTIGPIVDVASGNVIATEVVSSIGLIILPRVAASYPLDIRATVTFNDSSTQSVTATVSNVRGADETFFGFAAPENLTITQLRLQSFSPGTTTPVANRIVFDDLSFVTKQAFIPPAPVVENISPANYAITPASNGIQFAVRSFVYIDPTNITFILNSVDRSSELVLSGNSTNRIATFTNIVPDQEYTFAIIATNTAGSVTATQTFYTATSSFVLYDSQSFTNDTLYPVGPLQAVTDGRATWSPNAAEPAQIVDVGDPQGKVLQRQGTGLSRADFLDFPPVSSGTMTIEFDALASTASARTFDICLQPLNAGSTIMGPFLAWGQVSGKLAYFDNVNWIPISDLGSGWHHYKIVSYLSGPAAGRYDVEVDGSPVAQRLVWRNAVAGSAFSRFRIQTQDTAALFEYGNVDNLAITAGPPDLNAVLSPTILNVAPAHRSIIPLTGALQFEVAANQAISGADVGIQLNGNAVSGTVTNSTTNHLYGSYVGGFTNGNYTAVISATNSVGSSSATTTFIATDEPWILHPANGWVEPWEWTSGMPTLLTADPIDGNALRLDTSGGVRNFMREYTNGVVDINREHFIRWKFRLKEDNFAANFNNFNDRVHFFGRNGARLANGTDANDSWAISATGAEQNPPGSGVSAGQILYIFDNVDGTGAYNLNNLVNSGLGIFPDHVYSFELLVSPPRKTYTVKIVDQTSAMSFTSSAPHRFRDLSDAPHDFLHFGVQANVGTTPRAFDLDSVSVVQAAMSVTLLNAARSGADFSFSFVSQSGATHVAEYATSPSAQSWTTLSTIPGDGTSKTVTHSSPPAGPLYYRVRTSLP